ncbi:hypothetical protein EV702DRAFT_1050709 [Suillus placidus]|uniref:Uncharacterized protein n=1 Tax=Suillus placidus TaxID=48579 RepID=A0A9P6ZHE2_9AGAM|nr:hypothetical protein EV702DRAFT_1050709 [Suillus placidus]
MPRRRGQGRRVVAPTAAEPLPTADPITPAIPAITPAITPAIPAITPAITSVPTAILASAHATTLHIARRLPTANIPTRTGPSHTTDEGEYFNLDVSGEEDEDGAAPSPLQTTTGTAQTDPYATGGRVKRPKAAQDSLHFFRDDTTNKCRVCKLWSFMQKTRNTLLQHTAIALGPQPVANIFFKFTPSATSRH